MKRWHLLVPERVIELAAQGVALSELFLRHNPHREQVSGQRHWVGDLERGFGKEGVVCVYSDPFVEKVTFVSHP